jgi:hypothetical protein
MSAVVHEALCPRVWVYSTNEVDGLLQRTIHLPNLATLLQPWQSKGVERVTVRTSTFEASNWPVFPLRIDAAAAVADEGSTLDLEGSWLDALSTEINQNAERWLAETPMDSRAAASLVCSNFI